MRLDLGEILKHNFLALKKSCEELIRDGKIQQVRAELLRIKLSRIPRDLIADFSNFARRSGLPKLGMRILHPIVRPTKAVHPPASSRERIAYASLLIKLGSTSEARQILEKLANGSPDAQLYFSFACIHEWDYETAIGPLQKFIGNDRVNEYDRAVASINLAAAHGALKQYGNSKAILTDVLKITEQHGWRLLEQNALELSAQTAVGERNWPAAARFLARANQFSASNNMNALFVKKWQAIMTLESKGSTPRNLAALAQVRAEALGMHHWETVRDCDYRRGLYLQDESLLNRVYFGTPYIKFRESMAAATRAWLHFPTQAQMPLQGSGEGRTLDVGIGMELESGLRLKPGQALHRLLIALTSDLYRPLPTARVFSDVFPGEYWNPVGSPKKTFAIVARLRAWFERNHFPLKISAAEGAFCLQAESPYQVILHSNRLDGATQLNVMAQLKFLREGLQRESFTAKQAALVLGQTNRSVQHLMKKAIDENRVHRDGNGPATIYHFIPMKKAG